MKYLFFMLTLLVSIFSQAYLVKGVRTTVVVKGINSSEIAAIFLEGCDVKNCSKAENKSKCNEDGNLKFYCHINDQYPKFIRFAIILKRSKILISKFVSTNGESVLDNFNLVINQNTVQVQSIKSIL